MIRRRLIRSSLVLLPLLLLLALAFSAPAADTTVASVELTAAERQWLKAHPVITLAPDPDFKPIEYFDKNGTYQGAAADIIRILEKKLGITITVAHLKNWDEAMEKFKKQEVDLLGAMVRTPNREKFALFTETLVAVPGGIFARSGTPTNLTLKDLKGKKVAVVSNYTAHDILRNQYPDINLEVVPDVSTGLAKVSLGMVDAYVENMANATFYSQEAGITNLQVAGRTEFDYRWGIGVRKDWPELQGILNKGLAAISQEERAQAIQRWIFIEGQRWQPTRTFIIGSVAVSLAALLVLVIYWNYSLHKVVRNRTATLQQELEERQKAEDALKNLTGQLEERVRERTAELQQEIGERRAAERHLAASEELLRLIMSSTVEAVYGIDTNGICTFANQSCLKLLGYENIGALLGRNIHDLIHYQTAAGTPLSAKDCAIIKVLHEGIGVIGTDEVFFRSDGSSLPVEYSSYPIRKDGEIVGAVVTWRDITDRRLAEEAMLREKEFFAEAMNSLPGVFYIISPTDKFLHWNENFETVAEYSAAEFGRMSPLELFTGTDKDLIRERILETFAKGASSAEAELVSKNGRRIPYHFTGRTITIDGLTCLIGMGVDITVSRQREALLKISEERFRSIVENLQDVYYRTDAEGRLTMISPSGVRLFGYNSPDDMLGKVVRETFYCDPNERDVFIQKLKMNGHLYNYEVTLRSKDGTPIPVATSTHLIFDADGSFTGVEGIFRDVSAMKSAAEERLQLERQLLHAQKLESLGVLAGGIAHDFNNILTAIIGNAEMALMKLNPESPVLENLARIEKAAARAADLARQMLAYSGKGRFVIEAIDLNRLVEEMGHMLEVSISKKAVTRYNLTRPLPAVNVDATQIRQIIMNLVINASEAIGDQSGVIAITTGWLEFDEACLHEFWLTDPIPAGLYVSLEIADSGCGMDKETLERIFDPFFTTKFTGRGLGMAAVLGIVRGHKGAIKVSSELGRGSSFKVLLPAGEKPAELFDGKAAVDSWQGSGTALLVDDEETVRAIGAEMLKELGFDVITARDGREAVELFKTGKEFRVVILDLTMPHVDGEQCFRELRRLHPDVKVIISSGFSEHEVTQKFVGKGLAGFVQKPYKLSTLRDVIKEIMSS